MLIGRVARGGSRELDLGGDKRRTKTGTKFTKNISKKVLYHYSSKLTKFFRKIGNADVLWGEDKGDRPHLPTLDPSLHATAPVLRCFLSDIIDQLVYQTFRRKNAERFQAKMIYAAQKRSESLTFEYRFTSFARKHSFDFITIIVPYNLPSLFLFLKHLS